jgi:hypothetical protein
MARRTNRERAEERAPRSSALLSGHPCVQGQSPRPEALQRTHPSRGKDSASEDGRSAARRPRATRSQSPGLRLHLGNQRRRAQVGAAPVQISAGCPSLQSRRSASSTQQPQPTPHLCQCRPWHRLQGSLQQRCRRSLSGLGPRGRAGASRRARAKAGRRSPGSRGSRRAEAKEEAIDSHLTRPQHEADRQAASARGPVCCRAWAWGGDSA